MKVWDYETCQRIMRSLSIAQKEAEEELAEAGEEAARSEQAYRVELAKAEIALREQGLPATLIPDLARGREEVAQLKMQRDLAEVRKDSAGKALWRHASDRKDAHRLVDYSLAVNTGRALD